MESQLIKPICKDCKKNMICLLPEERKYKCYKCLDQSKDYMDKDEVAKYLSKMCGEIVEREIFGEKYKKFKEYQKQNKHYTEEEIAEILKAHVIPDEEKQNPHITELRKQVKIQQLEIQSLKDLVNKMKIQALSIDPVIIYQRLNLEELLFECIDRQYSVDILDQYKDQVQVQLWMIEWALRSGRMQLFECLLERYFKGISIIRYHNFYPHMQFQEENKGKKYQIVAVPTSVDVNNTQVGFTVYQIIYDDDIRYLTQRIPIETISVHPQDEEIEDRLIIYSFFAYHFKQGGIGMIGPKNNGHHWVCYGRDLSLTRFQKQGKMLLCNLSNPNTEVYCKNAKLTSLQP